MRPLEGLLVLDFTTLLPGPLATLWLAEAGARVVKVERPGTGDEMRAQPPVAGGTSVHFTLLNAGKESLTLDLKDPAQRARLEPLLRRADILVEQFRPGVMDRLGLGYEAVRALNPGIVYCSITGYGQSGEKSGVAAHDLNYVADVGMLALTGGSDGEPVPPAALVADIGAGSLPAVLNVLLALLARERSGEGAHLDVAMTDNLFPWLSWALANELGGDRLRAGSGLLNGGSPRYAIYRAADGRHLAVGALEDRFWLELCRLLGLSREEADDSADPQATRRLVAERFAARTADEWLETLAGHDTCCNLVRSLDEALADEHYRGRGLFDRRVTAGGGELTALPTPVAAPFRGPDLIPACRPVEEIDP